jgi:hypothetical protein
MPPKRKTLTDLPPGKKFLFKVIGLDFKMDPILKAAEYISETPARITFANNGWSRAYVNPKRLEEDGIGRTPEEAVDLFRARASRKLKKAAEDLALAEDREAVASKITLDLIELSIAGDYD